MMGMGGWGGGGHMGMGGVGEAQGWGRRGMVRVPGEQSGARWSGAGTLRTSDFDEDSVGKLYDHEVVTRLMRYLTPYKGKLLLALVGLIGFQIAQRATPAFVGWGINTIKAGDFDILPLIAGLFLSVHLLGWGGQWLELVLQMIVGQKLLLQFRTDMFAHLNRLAISFFDQNEVGRVMSRVQNDVQAIQEFLTGGILTLVGDFLSMALIIGFMALTDLKLTLIAFAPMPLLVVALVIWQRWARSAFVRVRQTIALVNASLQENISGVRVSQSMAREERNMRRFDEVNEQNLQANIRQAQVSAIITPVAEIVMAISLAATILYGGSSVLSGAMQVGSLVAFLLYIQQFYQPIRMLVMEYTQIQRAMVAGQRIFEVLDQVPEIVDRPDAIELPDVRGEVDFEHVDFHYFEGMPVLRDVNLHVPAGQTVAIVGPTGAGKTSMVALLSRAYEVKGGRLLIDGHDMRDVALSSLVRRMGAVLQDPILFSGTIRDNIRYGRPEASDEEVMAAAKAVGVHEFIENLENSYDTLVHERGQGMSMGQRQLVCFARAVLMEPRILILDEATANIDTYSEVLIQRALRELLKGRTSFVIAHRLSTIRDADRILVMDKGTIVEDGQHEELLARGGLYAELYAMNFLVVESGAGGASDEADGKPAAAAAQATRPAGGRELGRRST